MIPASQAEIVHDAEYMMLEAQNGERWARDRGVDRGLRGRAAREIGCRFHEESPRHQVYDVINDTVEGNEIPPELWYPKGHKPELVREWPLTEDVEIPNPFATPEKTDEGSE